MKFTLSNLDFLLLLFVRVTGFIYTAPFFSLKNVPQKVKVGLSGMLAIVLYSVVPGGSMHYASTVEMILLIAKEAACGAIIGYFANIAYYILSMAGHLMDTEIGFSMVSTFDPVTNIQVTITSNLYTYLVMLVMMISDLHHYIIKAFVDSYTIVPVGKVVINGELYKVAVQFIVDYFIIAFRIVLPVFAAILVVNVVLGVLAKVAPQMNMFVIGMQLKVFVGLIVLYFVIQMVPAVGDFIFNEMLEMMKKAIYTMAG